MPAHGGGGGASIRLDVSHAFGSLGAGLGNFRDVALFGDEAGRCLITPVGRHVALRHVETGEATFLLGGQKAEAVTACAISHDKSLLAICEFASKESPQASVAVYDLRQEPLGTEPLNTGEPMGRSAGKVVAAGFSCDQQSRYLCFICAGAEYSVVVFDWRADKIVVGHALPSPADRVLFAPNDANLVSVSGACGLRLVRLSNVASKSRDAAMKLMPPFSGVAEGVRINDHSWAEPIGGHLVACDAEGPVYVLDAATNTVISTIEKVFLDGSDPSSTLPLSLRCFSQGFLVGGGEGTVAIWERIDSPPTSDGAASGPAVEYKHARTAQVRETNAGTCSLDFSGSEEFVVFGFRSGDVGVLQTAALYTAEYAELQCAVVNGGFHSGPVIALDVAAQRPLVVSACRQDWSIRLWNYATKTCELQWKSPGEPPLGVALHPLGYIVAVSFQNRVCFFYALINGLKPYREIPVSGCRLLRFSNGGHLLAAATGGDILIISTRDLKPVAMLQGEGVDSKSASIVSLCFRQGKDGKFDHLGEDKAADGLLYACSAGGGVAEWDTQTWQRNSMQSPMSREFICAAAGQDGVALVSAKSGSKAFVQRLLAGILESEQELPEKGVRVTAMCCHPASGAMFWATSSGRVWCYTAATAPAPGTTQGVVMAQPLAEQGLHQGPINCICLSPDGQTLLTSGEDGAIFTLAITGLAATTGGEDQGGGGEVQSQRMFNMGETVLLERREIQQRNAELNKLRDDHAMLSTRLVEESSRLEAECEQRLAEARQKDQAEIAELQRRCSALALATEAKVRDGKRIAATMKASHEQAAEQLSGLYQRKLEYESDRYVDTEAEHYGLKDQIKTLREKNDLELQENARAFQAELSRQLEEKELEVQKHKDIIAFTQQRFDKMLDQEQNEHNLEIAETKMSRYEDLEKLRQTEIKLRREQEALLEGLNMMEKDRASSEKKHHEAVTNIGLLQTQKDELTRTVKSLHSEAKERESTLSDKEMKIDTYSAKVSKLKKFKHVLDSQLLDITDQLEPKNSMIGQLNEHLHELEGEFENQLAIQRSIEGQIDQHMQQIAFLRSEEKDLREEVSDKDRLITRFTEDLHSLVTKCHDVKTWPEGIRKMYHTYVCKQTDTDDRLPIEECQRNMRLLERQVASLAVKGWQAKATCKADERRKAHEGAVLIAELNELRVSRQHLNMKIKGLQVALDRLNKEMAAEAAAGGTSTLVFAATGAADKTRAPEPGAVLRPDGAGGPPALGIEDEAALSPPPALLPKSPRGSLPGPRQRSTALPEQRKARSSSVVGGLATAKRSPSLYADMTGMDALSATLDTNSQQLNAQKDANRRLRAELESLTRDRAGAISFSAAGRRQYQKQVRGAR